MKKNLLSILIQMSFAGAALAQTAVPPPAKKSAEKTDAPAAATKGVLPTEIVPHLSDTNADANKAGIAAQNNAEPQTLKSSTTVTVGARENKSVRASQAQPVEEFIDLSKTPGGLDSNDVRLKTQKARAEFEATLKAKANALKQSSSPDKSAAPPRASTAVNTQRTEVIETTVWPNNVVPGSNVIAPDAASGLKIATGKSDAGHDTPIVIEAVQGVNQFVQVARGELNRFVTPFEKVKVRTAAGEEELVSKVDGNIVYIGVNKRAGVFLTEVGSDRAISLTLDPADVPQRDVYTKWKRAEGVPAALSQKTRLFQAKAGGAGMDYGSEPRDKSQSHVDAVKDVMRDLALGKLPSGYSLSAFKAGEAYCAIPGFKVRLGQMIDGGSHRVAVFRAENNTALPQQIDEQFCYRRGVVAVSAWPDVVVQPKGVTEVFVLMQVQDPEPASSMRPSLLWSDPEKARLIQVGDEE